KALAVVDAYGVAEYVEWLREGDCAGCDRTNRFARRGALVHPAVIFARWFAVVQTPDAKGRSHAAGHRRSERILPKAGFGDLFLKAGEQGHFFRRGVERLYFRAEFYIL